MKKKIAALALVVALLLVAVVGGTMAYFTDTDSAKNVMTVGSVEIKQLEQERAADGTLQPFTQKKPIVPAAADAQWADETVTIGGKTAKVFIPENNAIDKFISVNNTGKSDAYVRTIVALESTDVIMHANVNDTVFDMSIGWKTLNVKGVNYDVAVFTLPYKLEAGAEGPACFHQVFMDKAADNKDAAAFGDTFEILAVSQAVQADGFASAADAFKAAYDKGADVPSDADLITWLSDAGVTHVTNADELQDAINNGSGDIVLDNDIDLGSGGLVIP